MTETMIPNRSYTFEDVWAALMEDREHLKETDRLVNQTTLQMKETDRRMQETDRQIKENDRKRQEEWAQLKKSQKKLDKQMGDLHNRFGEMAEHLVAPGIVKRFNEMGFHFDAMSPKGQRILDEQCRIKTQVDILLENGEYIIAVEVKANIRMQDIEHHIRRLEIVREHRNKRHDERKIQGALAGAIFGDSEKKAAIEAGFYVLEQSGDTMRLDIPEGFVPREF